MSETKLTADEILTLDTDIEADLDEVDEVLSALRLLAKKVSTPFVKACLDSVRGEIAHLASCGDEDACVTPPAWETDEAGSREAA